MKKRILAMLLVLCMVASVMPMTVLAAETKCPYEGAEHTLNNCDATLVLNVPAENCQQKSYDLYKCNKCGDLFAANFGDFGAHIWVLMDQEIPALACGVGEWCAVCYTEKDHKFDCAGKCVCGEEGPAGHNWDQKLIQITKEPVGCKTPGEATYTCGDCGVKKLAPVYGKHIEVTEVAAVAPECKKEGLLAHTYCAGCDSYWIDGVEVEKKDVILAPAHTGLAGEYLTLIAEPEVNIQKTGVAGDVLKVIITIPANSEIRIAHRDANGNDIYVQNILTDDEPVVKILTVNPTDTYIIRNRGTVNTDSVEIEVAILSVENDLELWIEPSCGGYGFYQVYCEDCNELVTIQTIQNAHAWVLDEFRSQEATCEKFGYEFWICDECGEAKPIKMIPKKNCVDTWAEVLAANKAKPDSVIVIDEIPATCTQKGYYKWECPICHEHKTWEPKALGCKLVNGTLLPTKCTVGYNYKYCSNENCDNDAAHDKYPLNATVSALVGKCVHSVSATLPVNKKADHAWYLDSTSATCTEAGYELYLCEGCGADKLVAVKAYGHSGFTTKAGEINELIVVDPTCWYTGESYYTCLECLDTVYVTKDVPFVHKSLMSVEEALASHYDIIIPDYEDWTVVPTCEKVGYVNVDCLYCMMNELADGHHSITLYAGGSHVYNGTYTPGCEPTYVPCEFCGEDFKVHAGFGHDWSIPGVAGDCFTNGYEGYGVCNNCGEEREIGNVIPAGHHYENDAAIVATCTKWGGQPQTCARDEMHSQIIDYVPNTHYVGEGGTVVKNEEKSDDFHPCFESGTEVYNCTVRGCNYKYEVEVTGLGYHVNWSDYRIYPEKCLDCNLDIHNMTDYRGHIGTWFTCKHCGEFTLTNLGIDPDCENDGYYVFAYTCGHSGYQEHVKALGHKWSQNKVVITEGEFANLYKAHVCEQVGFYGEDLDCDAQYKPESLHNVEIVIKNDLKKDEVLHDGALVKITVSLKAYAADMFGYSFDLNYDPAVLQLVDFAPLSELFPYNANVNTGIQVVKPAVVEDGKVKEEAVLRHYVRVMGQKIADGKNTSVEGYEELVELTFKINNPGKLSTVLAIDENLEIYKNVKDGKHMKLADVACINPEAEHELRIRKLMDANNDGFVDYLDCATVWQLYSGVLKYEYRENLDLNHNGEIDHVDANLIYKYFAGYISYEEVLNYKA